MSTPVAGGLNYSGVHVLPRTNQIIGLHSIIRDKNTSREDFIFYSDRLIRLLIEEGLSLLPFKEKTVITPTGSEYKGNQRSFFSYLVYFN